VGQKVALGELILIVFVTQTRTCPSGARPLWVLFSQKWALPENGRKIPLARRGLQSRAHSQLVVERLLLVESRSGGSSRGRRKVNWRGQRVDFNEPYLNVKFAGHVARRVDFALSWVA